MPYELKAFAEDERAGKVGRHTHQNVGTLLFIEGGEVGAVECGDGSPDLFGEKGGYLPVVALPYQHGHHFVALSPQNGSQGECLCIVPSSFSLYSEQKSHTKRFLMFEPQKYKN
jgi:hypothetical protein